MLSERERLLSQSAAALRRILGTIDETHQRFKPLPDFDEADQGPHVSEPQEWPDEGDADEQC